MKRKLFGLLILFVITAVSSGCRPEGKKSDPYGLEGKTHSAVTPVEQKDPYVVDWWLPRHKQLLERTAQGNVDLLMVGDSITHGWEDAGKEMWDQYYAGRNAVNLGFLGDSTQHVLWRIDQGAIDGINPKLAVVLIGTNNSGRDVDGNVKNSVEEMADGIKAICARIRTKLPETKILLLAIFPRGYGDYIQRREGRIATFNSQWAKNNRASELASQIADDEMIFYLDINKAFLNENDAITREIMPDLLHLSKKGYKIWAEAMEPTIKKLMDED